MPAALLLLLLPVVLGAQRCQEDRECRGFRRTECTKLQPSFLNILPPHCVKYNTYTEPGRCTTVTDGLCKIGNTFRQKKAKCRQTRQCANCIGDRDCYGTPFAPTVGARTLVPR